MAEGGRRPGGAAAAPIAAGGDAKGNTGNGLNLWLLKYRCFYKYLLHVIPK